MSGTPYQYVIPATEENIDIRLGSIGVPALDDLTEVQQLYLTMFLHGACACLYVKETLSGRPVIKTLLFRKP